MIVVVDTSVLAAELLHKRGRDLSRHPELRSVIRSRPMGRDTTRTTETGQEDCGAWSFEPSTSRSAVRRR